jgi:phosphatidyl-myo-inositol dimannoside synthase
MGRRSGEQLKTDPINVLMLVDRFLPHAGGSRVYYHNLYKHLSSLFPGRVTILTGKSPGWEEFDGRESTESLEIVRRSFPMDSWKYTDLPGTTALLMVNALRQIQRRRPHLIHCGDLFPQGLVSIGLKHLLGLPYIAYAHGEEITQTSRFRVETSLRNRIYRSADAVVINSEFTRRGLLEIGIPADRIHKITPGVDAERFRPEPKDPGLVERFGLAGKIVILTVGRLIARKGQRRVLEAAARLREEFPDLRYVIVGTGQDEGELGRTARQLGIENMVVFAGAVPDESLASFYNLCDIFVMPNEDSDGDTEGFGMVFLEANAAGKPVIGGRDGGTEDAIVEGETGFRVDTANPEELTTRLRLLLLSEQLRRRMGDAGLRRARFEFAWENRSRQLRTLSAGILQKRAHAIEEPACRI